MYGMDGKLKLVEPLKKTQNNLKYWGIYNLRSVIFSRVLRILTSQKRFQSLYDEIFNIQVVISWLWLNLFIFTNPELTLLFWFQLWSSVPRIWSTNFLLKLEEDTTVQSVRSIVGTNIMENATLKFISQQRAHIHATSVIKGLTQNAAWIITFTRGSAKGIFLHHLWYLT